MIKKLLVFACLASAMIAGSSVADANYVQALPTPAPITGTLSDANQAFIDTSTPTPKPKKTIFHKHHASQVNQSMDDSAQTTLLLSRVMQVNQDFLNYQSKTTAQLSKMQSDHQQLAQQVSTLAGQMALLSTKITALAQVTLSKEHQPDNVFARWQQQVGTFPFYAILAIILLLLVIVILMAFSKKKPAAAIDRKEQDKGDYDYLSTKEAIPAKLDLARSYIVMEDFDAAKAVLAEVIMQGDEEQIKLAESLQEQCNKDNDAGAA